MKVSSMNNFNYDLLDEAMLDDILNKSHQEEKDDEKAPQTTSAEYSSNLSKSISAPQITKEEVPIGSGKFGKIYRGKYTPNDTAVHQVAIKEYEHTADYTHERCIIERISKSTVFDNASKYQHLVQPYGFCGELFVAEFVSGGSGDRLLHSTFKSNIRSALRMSDVVDILCDVCNAMRCLHGMGIIHRDLSARNLLFCSNASNTNNSTSAYTIKICDFGEAEIYTEGANKTKSRKGPYLWLSPESIRQQIYSVQTDIYSFGIVCYELIVGSRPLPKTPVEVAVMEILSLSQRPNVTMYYRKGYIPLRLFVLVQLCWQQIADYRPTTFDQVLEELLAVKNLLVAQKKEIKNVVLSDVVFDSTRSKDLLKTASCLVSEYLVIDSDDTEDDDENDYIKTTKQMLLKRMFNYGFAERTDIDAVNFYLHHFPWGQEKTQEQHRTAVRNVDQYTKQFEAQFKFVDV